MKWVATDDALVNVEQVAMITQEGEKLKLLWSTGNMETEVAYPDYGAAKLALEKFIRILEVKEEV